MSVLYGEVDINASQQAIWTALYKERIHYETKVTNWHKYTMYLHGPGHDYLFELPEPEKIENSHGDSIKTGKFVPFMLNYHMSQKFKAGMGTGKCSYDVFEYPYTQIRFRLTDSNVFKHMQGYWGLYAIEPGKYKLVLDITEVKLKLIPVPATVIRFFAENKVKERLQAIKLEAESL